MELTGRQRRYLIRQAHQLHPSVMIGKEGPTDRVCAATSEALDRFELIKIRFQSLKQEKREVARLVAEETGALVVQIVGHIAVLYRRHPSPERRTITLPESEESLGETSY